VDVNPYQSPSGVEPPTHAAKVTKLGLVKAAGRTSRSVSAQSASKWSATPKNNSAANKAAETTRCTTYSPRTASFVRIDVLAHEHPLKHRQLEIVQTS